MSLFVPPRPEVLPKKASLWQHLRQGLRSGIGLFLSGSYESMGVGRHPIPTLPVGKKRWLFIVRTPDLIREVLVRRSYDFPKSALMDDMLRSLTGYSIFISNGEAWKRHRRLMDPAFEAARIKAVFPMMLDAVDGCVESPVRRPGRGRPRPAGRDRRGDDPLRGGRDLPHHLLRADGRGERARAFSRPSPCSRRSPTPTAC